MDNDPEVGIMDDKYLISEGQLIAIEIILKHAGIPTKRNVLLTEIRNTSLISELKKERERVFYLLEQTDAGACPHKQCRRGDGHDNLNCRDCLIKWIEESLRNPDEGVSSS